MNLVDFPAMLYSTAGQIPLLGYHILIARSSRCQKTRTAAASDWKQALYGPQFSAHRLQFFSQRKLDGRGHQGLAEIWTVYGHFNLMAQGKHEAKASQKKKVTLNDLGYIHTAEAQQPGAATSMNQ